MKIAIIGSGISGLSAAWLLYQKHEITVFEQNDYIGGHSNTVQAQDMPAVDTGFIVFNDWTYPNLIALLDHINVPTEPSDMSFGVSMNNGAYEYSSDALFAQTANYFQPAHLLMLSSLIRFYKQAQKDLDFDGTLGDYLKEKAYGKSFIERHIAPMAAAIWSANPETILSFPFQTFVNFFVNHGLFILNTKVRPKWHTVTGGSRSYVKALSAPFKDRIKLNLNIKKIIRHTDFVELIDIHGNTHRFDQVILAGHSDQSLRILSDASEDEKQVLSSIPYSENRAVLHTCADLMPKRRAAWASWNVLLHPERPPILTYWMNRLQSFIDQEQDLFVTLNADVPAKHVHYETVYHHPHYTLEALKGWNKIKDIQGVRRTWFCGAWTGYGFHEDGLSSGLAVAEMVGGVKRPWSVSEEKSIAAENVRAAA